MSFMCKHYISRVWCVRWPQFCIELGLLGLGVVGLVVGDAVLGALGPGAELQRPAVGRGTSIRWISCCLICW